MIVLFGNTNDDQGVLSDIAKSRCNKAIDLWNEDKSQQIITTGTFGPHFNTTLTSHSVYLKQYLVQNGVDESKILPNTQSSNTFQDVVGVRAEVVKNKPSKLILVTSDFHYGRVKFLCDLILFDLDQVLKEENKIYISAPMPASISPTERASLIEHEKKRMDEMFNKFPTAIYENADHEQKHYDTVSNWMITGELTTFALGYVFVKEHFSEGKVYEVWEKWLGIAGLFIAVTFFWMLYERAAATARTGRKTLRNIERCYGYFGFSLFYSTGRLKDFHFTFKRILEYLYMILACLLLSEASIFIVPLFLIIYFIWFYDKEYR